MEAILLLTHELPETVSGALTTLSILLPNMLIMTTTNEGLSNALSELISRGVGEVVLVNLLGEPVSIPQGINVRINWASPGNLVIQYLGSVLLKHLDLIRSDALGLIAKSLIALTGDPRLALMMRWNFDINMLGGFIRDVRSLVIDDARVLSFIDPRNVKPGLHIMCACNGSLSYTGNSLVVISMYPNLISGMIKLVNEGLKPALAIVTPPTLNESEISLKRALLTLNVPIITILGTEGGPHIAGSLLNAIFQVAHMG
ncbi:precorrin-8X methylmutase [Vulcanisaeta thermophila]|uniref:precorrin-8X methylmutase n=1 Tax=Vulcanisaeta thermophila TaxID=867917 RepID=UPI000852D864|nr:precorrin-8X methylmutase [Vulcanisaeta thermophila]